MGDNEQELAEGTEDMTRAEKEAHEDGVELAEKLIAEQKARPDDHELVVAQQQREEAEAEAEANPPVAIEGEEPQAEPRSGQDAAEGLSGKTVAELDALGAEHEDYPRDGLKSEKVAFLEGQ